MSSPAKTRPVSSHRAEEGLPGRTPPKERGQPHTPRQAPGKLRPRRGSTTSAAAASPADVVTRVARTQLRPRQGTAGGPLSAAPSRTASTSAALRSTSAVATHATRHTMPGTVAGTDVDTRQRGAATPTVAVVPYLRPAATPVVHVRIRPLLPYMGETIERRKIWFLDSENLIVRPQPRNTLTATTTATTTVPTSTPSASPTVPALSLAGVTGSGAGISHTFSPRPATGGRSPQTTPRKGTTRGSTAGTAPASGQGIEAVGGAADRSTASKTDAEARVPDSHNTSPALQPTTAATFGSAGEQHHRFDLVHSEDTSQEEVFEESVAYLVDEALLGQNVAVLCYGPTGSGKTYSMMGDSHPRHARLGDREETAANSPRSLGATTTTVTAVTATASPTTTTTSGANESPATDLLSETRVSSLTVGDDEDEDEDDEEAEDPMLGRHVSPHGTQSPRSSRSQTHRLATLGSPRQGRSGKGTPATRSAASSPAKAAAATLTATAQNSGWVTVDSEPHHKDVKTNGGASSSPQAAAAATPPPHSPALLRHIAHSDMGILPRLVCALLERRGETTVLRRGGGGDGGSGPSTVAGSEDVRALEKRTHSDGVDAVDDDVLTTAEGGTPRKKESHTSPSQTPRKGKRTTATGAGAHSSGAPPTPPPRVTLTLEDIRMYGVELYLDEVFDLLNPKKQPVAHMGDTGGLAALCQSLDRANGRNNQPTTTANSTRHSSSQHRSGGGWGIQTISDLRKVCRLARRNRVTGSHQRNDSSSRSHAVFILQLGFDLVVGSETEDDGRTTATDTCRRVHSFVAMVDLAGCERVKETQVAGTSLKEAQYINKSLSALSSVVLSLHRRSQHVPYRDSKLTRLLRPCLEGGRVLTLVHVAPCSSGDSTNALKFAHQIRHTMVKPHNYLSGTNQDALQTIFESLMDPTLGKLEEALQKTEQEYQQLCAEVRVALYARAVEDTKYTLVREGPGLLALSAASDTLRGTDRDSSAGRYSRGNVSQYLAMELSSASHSDSSGSSTLNISGEDDEDNDDEEFGPHPTHTTENSNAADTACGGIPRLSTLAQLLQQSLPDARADEADYLRAFTTELSLPPSATKAETRTFRLQTLACRDLAPRMAREAAALSAMAREVHQMKCHELETNKRAILAKAEALHAALAEVQRHHARLQRENMSPIPCDPYAKELSAQLKDTNEAVAASARERQQLTSLLTTLRQRLALQDDLETAADEEVAELRSKMRHAGTAAPTVPAAAPASPPQTERRGDSGHVDPVFTGPYAALLDGAEDAEMKEIHQLQVRTAHDLASLRLERACFGMGEAVWEGLWARAMRLELHMAMWSERLLMEHVLLQDAALEVVLEDDTAHTHPSPVKAPPEALTGPSGHATSAVSSARAPLTNSPRSGGTPRKGSSAETNASGAETWVRKKALVGQFMRARAQARQEREAALRRVEDSEGGEVASSPDRSAGRATTTTPTTTALPIIPDEVLPSSETGPVSRPGGVRRTSRPLNALPSSEAPTPAPLAATPAPLHAFTGPTLSTTSTTTTATAPGAVGGGVASAVPMLNPLESLVAASRAYQDAQSRRASLRTGGIPASVATSIDSALLTSGNTSVVAAAIATTAAGVPSPQHATPQANSHLSEPPVGPEVVATTHPPLPAPVSLVGTYGDELSLQHTSVWRLLEEGIPCEVSCIGDSFVHVWENLLCPPPTSSVLSAAASRRLHERQLDTTPLRQPVFDDLGQASSHPSAQKYAHSDDDDDSEAIVTGSYGGGSNERLEASAARRDPAKATLMTTHWGRLRLERSAKDPHAFSLVFVYLKDGGMPLPHNVAEAVAAPGTKKKDARAALLDALPASLDLRRGLTPPSSSPAALRPPSEQVSTASRERRLFAIPLTEAELTLHVHVVEAGAATASPHWSSRRGCVKCRPEDTTQLALELCHVPMTNSTAAGGGGGEGAAAAIGTADAALSASSQSSPAKKVGHRQSPQQVLPSRGRRAIHVPSTQPLPSTGTAGANPPPESSLTPPSRASRQRSLQSVVTESDTLRKRAIRMRSVVLAKRLQGGSELLLPSSCILGNATPEGSCTLLLRFPAPHFSNCTRLENVESIVAALCGLLYPISTPSPSATAAPSPASLRSPRPLARPTTQGANGPHSARRGSHSGRLSARPRRDSDAQTPAPVTAAATTAATNPFTLIRTHGRPAVRFTFSHIPRLLLDAQVLRSHPHARATAGTAGPRRECDRPRDADPTDEVVVVTEALLPPSSLTGGEAADYVLSADSAEVGTASARQPRIGGGGGALLGSRPHDALPRRRSLPLSLAHPHPSTSHAGRSRAHNGAPPRTAGLAVTFYFPGSLPALAMNADDVATPTPASPAATAKAAHRASTSEAAVSVSSAGGTSAVVPPLVLAVASSHGDLDTSSLPTPCAQDSARGRRRSTWSANGGGAVGGAEAHSASRLSRLRTPRASGVGLVGGEASEADPADTTVTTAAAAAAAVPVSPAAVREVIEVQIATGLVQQLRAVTVGGDAFDAAPDTATASPASGGDRGGPPHGSRRLAGVPREAFIALGLHQLQTLRRSVRAMVKQQTFDAEDIKGDYVGAFQVTESEPRASGQGTLAPLAQIRQEALMTIGLQLPGVQPPAGPLTAKQADPPARGEVTVAQARELGSLSVPWTIWQWAYRWTQVAQYNATLEQAQQHADEMQGGGAAGEIMISTAATASAPADTPPTTAAAGAHFPAPLIWDLGDTRTPPRLVPMPGSGEAAAGALGGVPSVIVCGGSPLLGATGRPSSGSDSDDDFAFTFGRGRWLDEAAMDTVSAPPKTVWLPALRFAEVPAFLEVSAPSPTPPSAQQGTTGV